MERAGTPPNDFYYHPLTDATWSTNSDIQSNDNG